MTRVESCTLSSIASKDSSREQPRKTPAVFSDEADLEDQNSVHSGSEYSIHSQASSARGPRPTALAHQETRAVNLSRLVVVVVLISAAAGVSALIYTFARNSEVAEFNNTFAERADQLTRTINRNAQHKLEATGAIALQVQAYAIESKSVWPNVTVPFFEERIMAIQSLTDAYGVQVFPVVTDETRESWEAYSVENRQWLNDSYFAQRQAYGVDQSLLEPGDTAAQNFSWFLHLWGEDYYNESNPDYSSGISTKIFDYGYWGDKKYVVPDPDNGPFFPQWQVAPASQYYQTTVNSNYGNFEDFFNQTQIIMETSTVAFGMAWTDNNVPGYISTMLYPIFDTFYGADPKVTAFIGVDLYWEAFIERILPSSTEGIYVVIENGAPCFQVFTFLLEGERALFMGDGNLHEAVPRYESMKQSFLFGSPFMIPITEPTYTGKPLYDSFCPYTFHLYPSKEMEDQHVTNLPMLYTLVVVGVFLFASLVFFTYDYLVERRQRLVLSSANQADAVVSSLFPQNVKEQLYQKEKDQQKKASKADGDRMSKFKSTELMEFMGVADPDSTEVSPIAELYPETTILFADLVGFTAWSSNRQPCEVFQLLETIYGAFDELARRRSVFKVETIGDCYVAATGLPKPQEDHALIMTKFAGEIRQRMRTELHNLADSLGPETLDLRLRVGIHSGPVTAGVLRGDKARFQLFGDSMNTAARMESHSAPDCIHVSESTAIRLKQAGKGRWVRAREDKINPKGKGEMQTFWVSTRASYAGSTATTAMDKSCCHSDDPSSSGIETSSSGIERTRSQISL